MGGGGYPSVRPGWGVPWVPHQTWKGVPGRGGTLTAGYQGTLDWMGGYPLGYNMGVLTTAAVGMASCVHAGGLSCFSNSSKKVFVCRVIIA